MAGMRTNALVRVFKGFRSRLHWLWFIPVAIVVFIVLVTSYTGLPGHLVYDSRFNSSVPTTTFQNQFKPHSRDGKPRVNHVRFLKVHKAASTTMQNLLFRYAIRHNLTVAMPRGGNYIYDRKNLINPRTVSGTYDIFATHTSYSKVWFDSMPIPADAVNIAIVREPKSRLISEVCKRRQNGNSILRKIPKTNYLSKLLQYSDKKLSMPFWITKNRMGGDFGFSPNKSYLEGHLRMLDKEFSLVLIVERFDESLVLLKRLLNWQLQDILYQVANANYHEQVNLTQDDLRLIKKLNYLDYAIYDHFAEIFDRKIKKEGNDFMEEVRHFKTMVREVSTFCSADLNKTKIFKASRWNEEFIFGTSECWFMNTKEMPFIKYLKERQHTK